MNIQSAVSLYVSRHRLLTLFCAALLLRWGYAALAFMLAGNEGIMAPDSAGYVASAQLLAAKFAAGDLGQWQWLGIGTATMPVVSWILTVCVGVFGQQVGPFLFVLFQGVVDALTCLIVAGLASRVNARYGLFAGVVAAINPTMIVLSGVVLTDTLFLFFCAASLYAAVGWVQQPSWQRVAFLGVSLGLAVLTRSLIWLWVPVCLLALGTALAILKRLTVARLAQLGLALILFLLFLSPILVRNNQRYGVWSVTSQTGAYALLWVVPLTQEVKDGTPYATTYAALSREFENTSTPQIRNNPFQSSRLMVSMALKELSKIGMIPIVKSWIYGGIINLAAPAATFSPLMSRMPRRGFYDTPGSSAIEKVWNYFFNSGNALYARLLAVSAIGIVCFRLVQLFGLYAVLCQKTLEERVLWGILLSWGLYILAIMGPIASAKYRLPIEPILCLLFSRAVCFRFKDRAPWALSRL